MENDLLGKYISSYRTSFSYEFDNRLMLNWYAKRITEMTQGGTALELGLGHGLTTSIFCKHFKRLCVIEGSSSIIKRYKEINPTNNAEIVHSYFEKFETDEYFDSLIMGFVLEHVNNPATILHKYKKYLTATGTVFISVPNAESLNRRIGLKAGILDDIKELSDADRALGHQRYFTIDSLHNLLAECNYKILREEGILLKPFSTDQIKSLNLSKKILQALLQVGVNLPHLCAGILVQAKPLL